MRRLLGTLILACMMLPSGASADEYSWPSDAPYSVSKAKMKDALECESGDRISHHGAGALDGKGRKHPVLLVHGTGVDRKTNWDWNYWGTLQDRGWEVCWVNLPHGSIRDIQVSSEYVAHSLRLIHRASGEKVDVIGHSQGGLQPRWAIKWFAGGRYVRDYIGLASPNHGSQVANEASMDEGCFESCWQLRRGSNFIKALNRDVETPGPIAYTSIYTTFDELVQPPGTQDLRGGSNILIQDLCPGRPTDHALIAADYITWLLVKDALLHKGPADPKVVDTEDCARASMPGSESPPSQFPDLIDFTRGEITDHEPPLKPYARP